MHPRQEELEDRLAQLCRDLDNHLEDIYGTHYSRHPNRPERGMAANPAFDGLFATSCAFTLGYGSKSGRGYVVNVEIRTLDTVSEYERNKIFAEAFSYVTSLLPKAFPERELRIIQENNIMKIVGDFSLGEV